MNKFKEVDSIIANVFNSNKNILKENISLFDASETTEKQTKESITGDDDQNIKTNRSTDDKKFKNSNFRSVNIKKVLKQSRVLSDNIIMKDKLEKYHKETYPPNSSNNINFTKVPKYLNNMKLNL